MTGQFVRLTPRESERLRADPDVAEDIASDEEELALAQGRLLDLDESWHGVHFLLNGEPWEVTGLSGAAGAAVLGGGPVGTDLGYGPPRLLTAPEVDAVATGLAALDDDGLRPRFDLAAWEEADVYPSAWEEESWEQELAPALAELREFYRAAAAAGQEVLLVIL